MLSFHPSPSRSLSYPTIYSAYPDRPLYSPYPPHPSDHPLVTVTDPGVRYRRALSEYLAAEEEYHALLRAREEARSRARAEALLYERARLLRVQSARAHQGQHARQLESALAKVLAHAAVCEGDVSFAPVMCAPFKRALSDTVIPCLRAYRDEVVTEKDSRDSRAFTSEYDEVPEGRTDTEEEGTSISQPPHVSSKQPAERSVPNLESLLRDRLQTIVGDEEVQDVARAILRHLTSTTATGPRRPSAAASSPDLTTPLTQPPEGADLSRSDALQGTAAEAAKESFRAHRAEVAERAPSPASTTSPSPLTIIHDIRSALVKLSDGFSLPSSLDFSDEEPSGLAYTPTNAPVRVYEHALDQLLAQLDAVESDGDDEVRVERRAAVKEVEKAIEDFEGKIREAREDAKRSGRLDDEEATLTTDNFDDTSKANESLPSSADYVSDSGFSRPEPHTLPDSPHDVAMIEDRLFTPHLESAPQAATVADPTLAPMDQGEASRVPSDDGLQSKDDVLAEQATAEQTLSAPSVVLSVGHARGVLSIYGSFYPRIPEDVLASFGLGLHSASPGREDEDGDADDEREWTEV
ncbi:hypothetical protein F5148DRAFT_1373967 [Russula earlei]|uniref:Uncharacterized protein n=1 Tax=Russula earlei TaxID=71964 RepID=A0ACC0UJ34_9AGAM|nr:hypothetical protein F5148DRAFT_1373967 [Russula earlei]